MAAKGSPVPEFVRYHLDSRHFGNDGFFTYPRNVHSQEYSLQPNNNGRKQLLIV